MATKQTLRDGEADGPLTRGALSRMTFPESVAGVSSHAYPPSTTSMAAEAEWLAVATGSPMRIRGHR
jgi:hypothetical protein